MEILGKLFGSESRVKILRLFLFNPEQAFCATEISERSKANLYTVRHELKLLRKVGFIDQKTSRKPKEKCWILNGRFAYLAPLRGLLLDTILMSDEEIYRKFAGSGKLKVVIAAGFFIQDDESRLDLLIAGENIKRHVIDNAVKGLEAEIGKELSYAAFEIAELNYRVSMYDRLLRDVVENPHRTLLDKAGFERKFINKTVK
jgi:hypothetical protein